MVERHKLTLKYTILSIALLTILLIPDKLLFDGKSLCIHKNILGIDCPLCGMTRATHDLAHFQFMSAFHYNPAIFLLLAFIISDLIVTFVKKKIFKEIQKAMFVVLIAGLVVLYILRIGWYLKWF